MKIIINQNDDCSEVEVIINCKETNSEILKLISLLREHEQKLTGVKDGKTHIVDPDEVYYFDTVDKKTFIYTINDVFETNLRLYTLEELLSSSNFFRASKSTIINISKIKTIVPDFGGRLEVMLQNNEKLIVSRQYAHNLKSKLRI